MRSIKNHQDLSQREPRPLVYLSLVSCFMVDGDLYATYGVEGDPSVAAERLDLYSSTHRPASCDQAQSPFGGTKPNFFKKNKTKQKTFVVFSVVALGNYISIQWMLIDTEMLPKPIIAGQPQSSQKTRGKKKLRLKFAPNKQVLTCLLLGLFLKRTMG